MNADKQLVYRKVQTLHRRYELFIIIDNDCGVDDAGAIMMALAGGYTEVVGISTVSGNVPLHQVSMNVLRLLTYLGKDDIPVYRGADRPLLEPARHAAGIHGTNGFGDVTLPETKKCVEPSSAPDGIYETARTHPGCTIVALGPLTNIACTIILHPDLSDYIHSLVIMGGALERGNTTRFAEFNAAADPEAAEIVFTSGIPITLIPWDPCLENIITEEELQSLGIGNSRAGKLFLQICEAPFRFFESMTGRRATAMADEIAMACCIDPSIITASIKTNIRMELLPTTMRGATITTAGSGIQVVTGIDGKRFLTILQGITELS